MVVREIAVFDLAYSEKSFWTSELPVKMAVVVDRFFEVVVRSDVLPEVFSVSFRMYLRVEPLVVSARLVPDLEIAVEADPAKFLRSSQPREKSFVENVALWMVVVRENEFPSCSFLEPFFWERF